MAEVCLPESLAPHPHHQSLPRLCSGLLFDMCFEEHVLFVFRELGFATTFVAMGFETVPAPLCQSVSEVYAADGFVLPSYHVLTSFQDPEGPPAKSWTSLLKEDESPEVSEGLRAAAEPHAAAPDGLQGAFLT